MEKMHWKDALVIYARRHGIDYTCTACCGSVFRFYMDNAESVDVPMSEIGAIIDEGEVA